MLLTILIQIDQHMSDDARRDPARKYWEEEIADGDRRSPPPPPPEREEGGGRGWHFRGRKGGREREQGCQE